MTKQILYTDNGGGLAVGADLIADISDQPIPAGTSVYVADYYEIAAGIEVDVGLESILEVG